MRPALIIVKTLTAAKKVNVFQLRKDMNVAAKKTITTVGQTWPCHVSTIAPTSTVASTRSTTKLFLAVVVHFQSRLVTNATAFPTLSTWTTTSPKNASLISATKYPVVMGNASQQTRLITATVIPVGRINMAIPV